MDSAVISAIIAAVVATLGVIASVISARRSLNIQAKDLELKAKELDATAQKLAGDLESVRQSQFAETLRKRADYYPKLWSAIRAYTTNWDDNHKPKDSVWVKDFLAALNQVDTEGGVFFSQAVYERFHELQLFLFTLKERLSESDNKVVGLSDLGHIDSIFRGRPGSPGLAAFLKDDLGSYRDLSIQARTVSQEAIPFAVTTPGDNLISIKETPATVFYNPLSCPPVVSPEELERRNQVKSLHQEWMQISASVLLRPTVGILAVESILRSQSDFTNILETLREYIASKILRQPGRRIDATESLIMSGAIDDFYLVDLALFIEDKFQVRIDDAELSPQVFDTLLELAAIVHSRRAIENGNHSE